MSVTSAESRAFRREWVCAGAAFLVVWPGLTFGAVYVFCKYVWPEGNWLSVLTLLQLLWLSLLGGGAMALGVWWVLNVWHHRLGYYLCPYCGRSRPRKGFCSCPAVQEIYEGMPRPLRRRSVLRHYRKRGWSILAAYPSVVPVALVLTMRAHQSADESTFFRFTAFHALLCLIIGIVIDLVLDMLKWMWDGKRFRKRVRIYVVAYQVWGLAGAVMMILVKLLNN